MKKNTLRKSGDGATAANKKSRKQINNRKSRRTLRNKVGGGCGCGGNTKELFYGGAPLSDISSYGPNIPAGSAIGVIPATDKTMLNTQVYSGGKGKRKGKFSRGRGRLYQRGGGWFDGILGGSFSINPIMNFGTSSGVDAWGQFYGSPVVNPSPAFQPVGLYGPSNPRIA